MGSAFLQSGSTSQFSGQMSQTCYGLLEFRCQYLRTTHIHPRGSGSTCDRLLVFRDGVQTAYESDANWCNMMMTQCFPQPFRHVVNCSHNCWHSFTASWLGLAFSSTFWSTSIIFSNVIDMLVRDCESPEHDGRPQQSQTPEANSKMRLEQTCVRFGGGRDLCRKRQRVQATRMWETS